MRRCTFNIVAIVWFVSLIGCCTQAPERQSSNNAQLAKTFVQTWSNQDAAALAALFSDSGLYVEVCTGRRFETHEEIEAYMSATVSGAPDSRFDVISIVSDSDGAAVEWVWKGTNTVGWPAAGLSPNGQKFEVRGVSVMRIKDGRILDNYDYWDMATFLHDVGAK